ncbi:hypothetical protein [Desulfurococcus amylolyticus]|uniref:hypothetical protein n=1 Tax=Desulfurococcus amylolyticus TaxID=94694 RepID=UPI00064EE234|nr:hypothetical protein [Desulfurococcus amylolyticus]
MPPQLVVAPSVGLDLKAWHTQLLFYTTFAALGVATYMQTRKPSYALYVPGVAALLYGVAILDRTVVAVATLVLMVALVVSLMLE